MSIIGHPNYIAPEVIQTKFGHSFEVDIWGLGICLFTMLVGYPPFSGTSPKEIHAKILKGEYKFPPSPEVSP
jgi:serine/threonine protein kinase